MMRPYAVIVVVALAVFGTFAAACGDDDDDSTGGDQQTSGEEANSAGDLSGAIVPDTLLTYEGQQYELKDILQADLVDASEFTEAGEASAIGVDGDPTVYVRDGDNTSVYTFFEGVGSGEVATPDNWYRWDPAD